MIKEDQSRLLDLIKVRLTTLPDSSDTVDLQQKIISMLLLNPAASLHIDASWFDGDEKAIFAQIKHAVKSKIAVTVPDLLVSLAPNQQFVLSGIYEQSKELSYSDCSDYNINLEATKLKEIYSELDMWKSVQWMLHGMIKGNPLEVATQAERIMNKSKGCEDETSFTYFGTDTLFAKPFTPMTIQGVPVFEAQNYYVVMGEEKSGKSHFLSMLLSALLYGGSEKFGIESLLPSDARILYVDSEQSPTDAQGICQTALILSGKNYNEREPRLIITSSDGMTSCDTLKSLEKAIIEHRPSVVFIDGYAGLLDDNYQNKGAESVMKAIRKIARDYNVTIIGIWHTVENPVTGKVSAFGAAGKLSQKFGGGTLLVTNEDGLITIKHHQSRKGKIADIQMHLKTVVIIDTAGGPDVRYCDGISVSEMLESMGKSINDDDVHVFAIPHSVTPEEAESWRMHVEEKAKAENLFRSDKVNEPRYRSKMRKSFGELICEPVRRDTLRENYIKVVWMVSNEKDESEVLSKRELGAARQAFKRCIDAGMRLGFIESLPHDKNKFRYIPQTSECDCVTKV